MDKLPMLSFRLEDLLEIMLVISDFFFNSNGSNQLSKYFKLFLSINYLMN